MTIVLPEGLLQSLHTAGACLADIRNLAEEASHLSAAQMDLCLRQLIDAGNERALSRLLQICAFNEVKIDAGLLCDSLGMTEHMFDSAPAFALQDAAAIEPLLMAATAEELPQERRCFAARMAAELTTKFQQDPGPARKVIRKFDHQARAPEITTMLAEALLLLDDEASPLKHAIPRWSEIPLSAFLPEHSPRNVVGGSYTVRRPVEKRGRNEPCHCGSGKKYKKCCYAKDQELLRDASPYAGKTMSELKANPGLVDDPKLIRQMRAHELCRLLPAELGDQQLLTAYQRASAFGLREQAFEHLLEYERRSSDDGFDWGHFEDLLEDVLRAGDLSLARRINDHCKDRPWWRPDAIAFGFYLLENAERFQVLERACQKALHADPEPPIDWDEPLLRLAYDFAPRYPALAIVFARVAILSNPDRVFDNEMLLDLIGEARVDLELEAEGDPAEALFDWIEARAHYRDQTRAENREIKQLHDKLDQTLTALEDKQHALRATEATLGQVNTELEKARINQVQIVDRPEPKTEAGADIDTGKAAALQRLRDQVANLKAEIGEQQAERRQLRKLLNSERKRMADMSPSDTAEETTAEPDVSASPEPAGTPILPEYTDHFRKRLSMLPAALAAKAILAIGRFASHDPDIWRQTKPLERLPEHYRIRLGRDHRLMVHWQPGKTLRVMDLIPRQDLESWIKRHG